MNTSDFTFIDLFAGIGGLRIPFANFGGKCVFSSEWDEPAQQTYLANFGEMPAGDIRTIDARDIPDHDILLAGFPCQPFSIIGDKQGFADTRGTLFFEIERILREKEPTAFLVENVKQLFTHDKGRTFSIIQRHLSNLGYTTYYQILNALDFGLPQKRERIFIIGFRDPIRFQFPLGNGNYKPLSQILEPDERIDSSFVASAKICKSRRNKCKIKPFYPSIWHENKGGNISVLPYSCALRAGASYNYLLVNGIRRPSSRELLRLQGFPEEFEIVVNITQLRKQTGNSVAVPVITAIAQKILIALRQREPLETSPTQLDLFEKRKKVYPYG